MANPLDQLSAVGLGDINTTLKVANQNASQLIQAIMAAFPQASASVSSSASGGAATLPANPVAFLTITVGSTAYKVPLYS